MQFVDTLKNLVTGLGTSKDKTVGMGFEFKPISDAELNAMHRSDWLSRKIVDIIPNDMTREWRDWQADDKAIEAIEAVEKLPLINLQAKVNEALRKARLFGGSAIYIGIKGARPSEPLELDRIGKDSLEYLHVLLKSELTPGTFEYDVTSEFYGEPENYTITGSNGRQLVVHPSRIVKFIGAQVLDTRQQDMQGWGDPILQVVYDAVQNSGSIQAHIASLVPEAKTDVIYVPGLSGLLQNKTTTSKLTDRFTYANTIKSMFNMVLLEGNGASGDNALGEKWEQKQINFSQLPELAQLFLQIAAGAADIPVTRLLGQSPSGLNATGDGDIRNYYDNISARQKTELQPRLNRIDEVVIRSALDKRDPEIHYSWAPLWGLSEKEKAEVFKTKADGARALAGTGPSPPILPIEALSDALANSLTEDGILPGLEKALEEFGGLSEQGGNPEDKLAASLPAGQTKPQDAEPRTLYVSRKVLNGPDIIKWAKAQGFTSTLEATDLHVTVMFSRTAVDWMKMGENWAGGDKEGKLTVPPGGARMVDKFDGGAVVLLFASSELSWRHEEMKRKGAEWDWPDYQPHITISYEGAPDDLRTIEPYRGKIVLGPEVFEEVKEDWKEGVTEQ